MPLPTTPEAAALLERFLQPPEQEETVETLFGLPPPVPTTNYFGRRAPTSGGTSPLAIAAKANELRMAQVAEQQVAPFFRAFREVDPSSPDYGVQRMNAISRYPLAVRDPRGKAVLEAADFAAQQNRLRDPNRELLQRAAIANVHPEEIAAFRDDRGTLDVVGLGNLIGQRERQLNPRRPLRDEVDTEINTLAEQYNALSKAGLYNTLEATALKDALNAKIREKVGIPTVPQAGAQPAVSDAELQSLLQKHLPK